MIYDKSFIATLNETHGTRLRHDVVSSCWTLMTAIMMRMDDTFHDLCLTCMFNRHHSLAVFREAYQQHLIYLPYLVFFWIHLKFPPIADNFSHSILFLCSLFFV